MKPQIWAHRGASAYAPENTLPAFQKAIQMGAHGIELDVHQSRDGALVVIHDETVTRTSNASGSIAQMTLAQLKMLDFGGVFPEYEGTRIPILQEVYELVKPTDIIVNVEIKCNVVMYWGIWDTLIALEHEMGMRGRILYSSFNHSVLPYIRALQPDAQIGLLYDRLPKSPLPDAARLRADAVHPRYSDVLRRPGLVADLHRQGVAVHTWTVDKPTAIRRLAQIGVEAIITNRPDVALAVVSSL